MFYSPFPVSALLALAVLAHGYDVGAQPGHSLLRSDMTAEQVQVKEDNLDPVSSSAVAAGRVAVAATPKSLMRSDMIAKQAPVKADNPDPAFSSAVTAEAHSYLAAQHLPEPVNFVINCPEDVNRLARFRKHMDAAGLTFEVFPCIELTRESFEQAMQEGFFGHEATRGDLTLTGHLGVALAHIKLLKLIEQRNIPAANIFEDDEIVRPNYKSARRAVLDNLPGDTEFINLNARDQRGEPVTANDPNLLRMVAGIPRWSNIWLSNYLVSSHGAKQLLQFADHFNLGPSGDQQIDWLVVEIISAAPKFFKINAYSYATNVLSIHCENTSVKEQLNKRGMLHSAKAKKEPSLLSQVPSVPVDPLCHEGNPEGLTR